VAHPEWRASAVGVYRLWRDGGYAVGALAAGLLADAFNIPTAIAAIGALTFLSGVMVAGVMYETLPARRIEASELAVKSEMALRAEKEPNKQSNPKGYQPWKRDTKSAEASRNDMGHQGDR